MNVPSLDTQRAFAAAEALLDPDWQHGLEVRERGETGWAAWEDTVKEEERAAAASRAAFECLLDWSLPLARPPVAEPTGTPIDILLG